ncbi:MAG: flagellar basal body L-ring protein FlgH [Gammaproteobacteria bacterium]|nr:flagellar basal body L-ring protein FlgH [Gammaproteobacteria bacterium]
MKTRSFASTTFATLAVLAIGMSLTGCNSAPKRDPGFAASLPAYRPMDAQGNGAIFQTGHNIVLFEDNKARRIGDLLTVRLTESTNATKSASTTVSRDQSANITNPTILGSTPSFNLPGILPLASTGNNSLETAISAGSDFEGGGDSAQSNSLNGSITVTVADVLPNGYLYVRGEKRLNLNQGNEYVKIAGIVRPLDIQADNSVPSTKIADATIIYNGDGATAESNRMGWLARFFNSKAFPF